jgi:hypothetical protein
VRHSLGRSLAKLDGIVLIPNFHAIITTIRYALLIPLFAVLLTRA